MATFKVPGRRSCRFPMVESACHAANVVGFMVGHFPISKLNTVNAALSSKSTTTRRRVPLLFCPDKRSLARQISPWLWRRRQSRTRDHVSLTAAVPSTSRHLSRWFQSAMCSLSSITRRIAFMVPRCEDLVSCTAANRQHQRHSPSIRSETFSSVSPVARMVTKSSSMRKSPAWRLRSGSPTRRKDRQSGAAQKESR